MKGTTGRRIAVLASGTVIGQGLMLLASPVLTRLYGPENFGVLGIFVALLSIAGVVMGLRYPLAIPLPEGEAEASDVLVLSLASVVVMSAVMAVFTYLARDWLRFTLGLDAIASYLWLLPLAAAVSGTYDALNYWAVRVKGFRAIAQTRVTQGLATVIGQVTLGVLGLGAPGLVVGQAMGRAAGLTTLLRVARKTVRFSPGSGTLVRLSQVATRYRRFPIFSTWSALANTLSAQLPIILLTYFFGIGVAGLYTLSTRVLQSPISIVGTAVAQVFLSDASGAARDGVLGEQAAATFRGLARISIPIGLVALLAAPASFEVLFGAEWRMAGTFTQLLVPWLVLVFLTSPLSIIPSVLGRQRGELIFNSAVLAARAVALLVGGLMQSPLLAVGLYGAVGVLGWGWFLTWTLRISGVATSTIVPIVARQLWASLPFVLPLIATYVLITGPARDVALLIVAAGCALALGVRILIESRRSAAND